MSTAHRGLKSPRSLSGTSAHHTMVTLVNIMDMNWWLTSFSFHVNWPSYSWDIAISDSDLETPRSRPWVWPRGNVLQSAQCYVAICDRRNLWRCRNLWLKVSQFVTGVANCDGKCRNLWQRQNMQFNDIYSLNFDKYFVLSSYLY